MQRLSRALFFYLGLCFTGCGYFEQSEEPKAHVSPMQWASPVTLALGNARIGPWEMNESEYHYLDDASVAQTEEGVVGVVWANNTRQNVFFQRLDAQSQSGFSSPVNVSRSANRFSWQPRVRFQGPDRVYVVWQEILFSGGSHGGDIFFARSTDGGRHFSTPVNLSQTERGAGKGRLTPNQWDNGSLAMALGPANEVYVAWTEYEGFLRFRRSTDGGETFDPVRRIAGDGRSPARNPHLALAPNATLYLTWAMGEAPASDIYLASSDDLGQTFTAPRAVYPGDGLSDNPSLVVDREGTLHLLQSERLSGWSGPSHVLYTQLKNAEQVSLGPTIISTPFDTGSADSPGIGLDESQNLYAVWEWHPKVGAPGQGLQYSFSTDGGRVFSDPQRIPGSAPPEEGVNGGFQGKLGETLSVNETGDLAIAMSHFHLGQESRILVIRGNLQRPPAN